MSFLAEKKPPEADYRPDTGLLGGGVFGDVFEPPEADYWPNSGPLKKQGSFLAKKKPPEAAAYLAPGLFCIETQNYMLKTQKIAILAAEKPRVRNFAGGKSPCGNGDHLVPDLLS